MNALLITRVIAGSTVVIGMSGCPSTEPSSPSEPRVPASASSPSRPTTSASVPSQLVLQVDGLTCDGCAWQIRDTLEKLDGIREVKTIVAEKRVVVTYEPERTSSGAVRQALTSVGYESVEISE